MKTKQQHLPLQSSEEKRIHKNVVILTFYYICYFWSIKWELSWQRLFQRS